MRSRSACRRSCRSRCWARASSRTADARVANVENICSSSRSNGARPLARSTTTQVPVGRAADRRHHGRPVPGGQLHGARRAPADDRHRAHVFDQPEAAGLVGGPDVRALDRDPDALHVGGRLALRGDDGQALVVVQARGEDRAQVGVGQLGHARGHRAEHLVRRGAGEQLEGHLGAGLTPAVPRLGLLHQPGVADGQSGDGGQRLGDLDVGLGEEPAGALLGEVQVAEDGRPRRAPGRRGRTRIGGCPAGKPSAAGCSVEVGQAEHLRFVDQQPEQPVADRQPADPLDVALVHPGDDEAVEPSSVRGQHPQGAVGRVHVVDRGLHDVVQCRVQVPAGRSRHHRGGEHRGGARGGGRR